MSFANMDDHDLEKGLGGSHASTSPDDRYNATSHAPVQSRNPHFRSELEIFQGLVGIHYLKDGGEPLENVDHGPTVSPLMATFFPSKTTQARMRNRGIYNRAVTQDLKNRSLYTMSRYIISGLYLLQILVAAVFTALSAYEGSSRVALTTLGAINTVVAGLLAWLTGQGMPTRYRRARDQYREVIRSIEAMERRFAQINFINWPEGQRPDPVLERDKLVKMFEEARKDQEANYPETTQTPQSDQMATKNDELRDEANKWKAKKKEQEKQLEKLKQELEEAKGAVKAGLKGGKGVMEELVEKI